MPCFCSFGLKLSEIYIPDLVHYKLLTNFGTGSAFSKDPGSAILEGPCPVLLYKL